MSQKSNKAKKANNASGTKNCVLVIGCGNVGSVGLHKMAQTPEIFTEIHVVSRTLEKCKIVRDSVLKKSKGKVKLNIQQGDVSNEKFLLGLLLSIQQKPLRFPV